MRLFQPLRSSTGAWHPPKLPTGSMWHSLGLQPQSHISSQRSTCPGKTFHIYHPQSSQRELLSCPPLTRPTPQSMEHMVTCSPVSLFLDHSKHSRVWSSLPQQLRAWFKACMSLFPELRPPKGRWSYSAHSQASEAAICCGETRAQLYGVSTCLQERLFMVMNEAAERREKGHLSPDPTLPTMNLPTGPQPLPLGPPLRLSPCPCWRSSLSSSFLLISWQIWLQFWVFLKLLPYYQIHHLFFIPTTTPYFFRSYP